MATVITFGNFKGGVGKTTATCMLSYNLYQRGYKVLVLDFDPQANSTKFLTTTFKKKVNNNTSLYKAIENNDLKTAIVKLDDKIDLLPSNIDLINLRDAIRENLNLDYNNKADLYKEHYYLKFLLKDLKNDYDFLIIDVPPTISEFTNNALIASDYTLIIMQTEPDSLTGAINYNNYTKKMKEFNKDLEVIGVLPYLENKRSKIDEYILDISLSKSLNINDLVFKNHIYTRERVKRFRMEGIKNEDHHDKNVLEMYQNVTEELLERLAEKNDKKRQ